MKEPLVRNGGGSPKVSPCSHKPEPICKEVAARIWKEERNLLDRVKEKKIRKTARKLQKTMKRSVMGYLIKLEVIPKETLLEQLTRMSPSARRGGKVCEIT